MRFYILFLISFLATFLGQGDAVSCVRCSFVENNIEDRICEDRCEGQLCYIVVNKYHNATIVADCADDLDEAESKDFAERNLCYNGASFTICGCMLSGLCNDPTAPISNFTFITTPILQKEYNVTSEGGNDKNETVSIHPVVTIEIDNVTNAALASSSEESQDSDEEENVTVETSDSPDNSSVALTVNDSEISVLPPGDIEEGEEIEEATIEEDVTTTDLPVSTDEKEYDEPISMKNMTAVGEVEEAEMAGDDDKRADAANNGISDSTTVASGTTNSDATPRVTTAAVVDAPTASASVKNKTVDESKSGVQIALSLTTVLLSLLSLY